MSSAQRQYLAKVLPWPLENEPGFINLHYSFDPGNLRPGEKLRWSGRACRSINEFISALDWQQKRAGTKDIYVCQSRQLNGIETYGKKNFRYYKADRSQANATALKSLFLDVDLKDYKSAQEILDGLGRLLALTHLPKPSCVVHTTGGYHIYWTLDRVLKPDEWFPLAHALVEACAQSGFTIDPQCTIDSARILRVPDTLNHKRNQLVKLVMINYFDYGVEFIIEKLLPFKVISPKHANGHKIDPAVFPYKGPLQEPDPLSAGMEHAEHPLIDFADVIQECEFLRNSATTGGANNDNPLWNLTTLLSTFMLDGKQLAHLLGRKHPTYSKEETDEFYARKLREREEKKLGWPSCQTIHATGSKFCRRCPHFKEGRSPLHFRTHSTPPPSTNGGGSGSNGSGASRPNGRVVGVLPQGYTRDARGYIQRLHTKADGGIEHVTVCEIAVHDAWLQNEPWKLNFAAEPEPGKCTQIVLPLEVTGAVSELRKELSRQGITLHDYQAKPMEEFILSWIQTLRNTKDAVVSTSPFGWHVPPNGKLQGFVYGGKLFTPTDIKVAQSPDVVTAKGYNPTGDIGPWVEAAKLITDQKRPALDAILASTFAAPLVRFTHMEGLMMSCVGESGIGKSTAMNVAMAVWGHPVRAKNQLDDTSNSVMNKVGELRNLPIFWDDLRPVDTKNYANMVFQVSYGKEKDRLNASAKRRESGTWQTIMVSTSNVSLLEYVTQHTNTTTAGVYRIFEIEVVSGKGGPGQIAKVDAAKIVGQLKDNYGVVGERYAEFLGKSFEQIEQEVYEYQKALDIEIDAQQEERLWTTQIACVCIGAKYSNQLGFTQIDEEALKAFLITSLGNMRKELKASHVDMTDEINVSSILTSYLHAKRAKNTLTTNIVHKGRGRPAKDSVKVIGSNTQRLETIEVQIGVEDKIMRIHSPAFTEWCTQKGISRHAFGKALEKSFGVKEMVGRLGSGTEFTAGGETYILELRLQDVFDKTVIDDITTVEEPKQEHTHDAKDTENIQELFVPQQGPDHRHNPDHHQG